MQKLIEIDFGRCGKALLRRSGIIMIVLVLFGSCGFAFGSIVVHKDDIYDARASIISKSSMIYGIAPESVQYADVVKSLTVAKRAAKVLNEATLDAEKISRMISAEIVFQDVISSWSSPIVIIHAQSADSSQAVRVVNAVTRSFLEEVANISGTNNISMLDEAAHAQMIYDRDKQQLIITAVAATSGLLLAVLFFLLREIFSQRLYYISDGTLSGQLKVIGVIPKCRKRAIDVKHLKEVDHRSKNARPVLS